MKKPVFFGAANQIRTGDLVLTKDVLYHLSHSSIFAAPFTAQKLLYTIPPPVVNPFFFVWATFCEKFPGLYNFSAFWQYCWKEQFTFFRQNSVKRIKCKAFSRKAAKKWVATLVEKEYNKNSTLCYIEGFCVVFPSYLQFIHVFNSFRL